MLTQEYLATERAAEWREELRKKNKQQRTYQFNSSENARDGSGNQKQIIRRS